MNEPDFIAALDSSREISFSEAASDADRTIQGEWLRDALTARSKCEIKIENAIITGVDIHSITVSCSLKLSKCTLEGIVADYCTFSEWVAFKDCVIDVLRFRGCVFKRALWVRHSTVARQIDLGYVSIDRDLDICDTRISGNFYAVGLKLGNDLSARFARFDSDFNMALADVTGQCDLNGAVVQGHVWFVDAKLGALTSQGATFAEATSFDRLSISSTCFLNHCTFCGDASFAGLKSKGQFAIEDSVFESDSYFESIDTNDVFSRRCIFKGDASFIGSNIYSAAFDGSKFYRVLLMHDTKIDTSASFSGVQFDGACRLDRVSTGASIVFRPFNGRETSFADLLSLSGARIGAQLNFDRVVFADVVTCEALTVGAELFFTESVMLDKLLLTAAEVRGNAEFTGSRFDKMIDATNCRIAGHCLLWQTKLKGSVEFIKATIGSTLNFTKATIEKGVNLDYATVAGRTVFLGAELAGTLSAKMAVLRTVVFDETLTKGDSGASWPFENVTFEISGLQYDSMDVCWQPLVTALSRSPLRVDRQPFIELEQMLRMRGHDDWADEVYMSGRMRSARTYAPLSGARIGDFISRVVSGYGVRPIWLFFWIIALVGGMTIFFSFSGTARPTTIAAKRYHCDRTPALFQALGLGLQSLAPGEPKVVDGWTISDCPIGPLKIKPFTAVGFFQILGAILIPFLVGQLTALWRYSVRRT